MRDERSYRNGGRNTNTKMSAGRMPSQSADALLYARMRFTKVGSMHIREIAACKQEDWQHAHKGTGSMQTRGWAACQQGTGARVETASGEHPWPKYILALLQARMGAMRKGSMHTRGRAACKQDTGEHMLSDICCV